MTAFQQQIVTIYWKSELMAQWLIVTSVLNLYKLLLLKIKLRLSNYQSNFKLRTSRFNCEIWLSNCNKRSSSANFCWRSALVLPAEFGGYLFNWASTLDRSKFNCNNCFSKILWRSSADATGAAQLPNNEPIATDLKQCKFTKSETMSNCCDEILYF